jgi:penicillin V acylase-like amidase (Ntn superfamily)
MKRKFLALFLTLLLLPGATLFSCTMFKLTINGKTLVGNNEDWKNPNTKIRFVIPEDGKYGVVYFSFDNLSPQGGMNDQGLVFDYMATQPLEVKNSVQKKRFRGDLMQKVMRECATVKEALQLLDKYNLQYFRKFQVMIVDKSGDSAIIEGDVIQRGKGNFQVCTNFYLSQLKKGEDIPCDRYKIATNLLSKNELTVDAFRNILSAVHQEGDWGGTLYSNIYDVNRGLVYLYHFHNYENVVVINLEEEFKKGNHTVDLPSLFPDTFAANQFRKNYK